ncbi:hypothetical protein LTS18_002613, partial [Coniosporium uncinatum]
RAETKHRIGKQEGDLRKQKQINQALEKQIRMLEQALKNERAKTKALRAGNASAEEEAKESANGKAAVKPASKSAENKPHNSFLDVEPLKPSEAEKDELRDKSRDYLRKCVDEITVLLTPPSHPPLPHDYQREFQLQQEANLHLSNHGGYQKDPMGIQQPTMPNHEPPPIPSMADMSSVANHQPAPAGEPMVREPRSMSHHPAPQTPISFPPSHAQQIPTSQAPSNFSTVADEQVEQVTHSFDSYGRPVPARGEEEASFIARQVSDDAGGWNFDEDAMPDAPLDAPQRRPDTDSFPS